MANSLKSHWYSEHRRWEDFLSAAIGVLIILSPAFASSDATTAVFISAGLTGVLVCALALLELMLIQRWEEFIELACGAWMIASPFVLEYVGALRSWHIVLGALVMLLAGFELWQDRNRSAPSMS
jgi:hypothetical protein